MRYVDIGQLELPNGWRKRATEALNALRDEIMAAENAARAAGCDAQQIAAVRQKAVSDGLKLPASEKIWRDLAGTLGALTKGKCWYSESRNPASDKNVDHFRPKARVEGDDAHEGYWWLAFECENYRYASQWCNQWRNDRVNGTSGGKADSFPLRNGSFRARQEGEDHTQEDIQLLDPIDPEDWKAHRNPPKSPDNRQFCVSLRR